MEEIESNSSYDEDNEVQSEGEPSEPEISIEEIKVEENNIFGEDHIHYEYLNDSPSIESDCSDSSENHTDYEYAKIPKESFQSVDVSSQRRHCPRRYVADNGSTPCNLPSEHEPVDEYKKTKVIPNNKQSTVSLLKRKRGRPRKYPKPGPSVPTCLISNSDKPSDEYNKKTDRGIIECDNIPHDPGSMSQSNVMSEDEPTDDEFESKSTADESEQSEDSPGQLKEPVIMFPKLVNDTDPDYIPSGQDNQKQKRSKPDLSKSEDVVNDRMYLNSYKRTVCRPNCIFKYCNLKDTALIPNNIRMKLLHEYKLYVLKSSKACSIHMRDQNWDELLRCTYNDFTATDIEDLLQLLKQASMILFDFEKIEAIPTRLIRYWMNVNKVQYKRICDHFPALQDLKSPKTALAVYLMYLQQKDVERIALLLQASEADITDKIKSVQAIVSFQNYDELNDMFQLEY